MRTKEEEIKTALEHPFELLRVRGYKPSLYEFLKIFWNEVSDDDFVPNWHIEYLCGELEKIAYQVSEGKPKEHDLIINLPPGLTKTISVSIMFPAWCWTRWYWMKFITASYSATLALESAEKMRDMIRSDKFRRLWPEILIKEDKDTKSNFQIVRFWREGNKNKIKFGGNRYSTSVGGTLTGFHGHILIVDDPLNPQQAVSEKELDNVNRWMEHTLPTRKTEKAISPMVLVMQRLSQQDPTGRILEKKKKNVKHICLPGEIRNYGQYLKPKELENKYQDGLLDPARLSWEVLADLEVDLGQYGFAGQIGQNPTPPGGGMFKVDHMPVMERMSSETNVMQTVRYWDKAGTQGGGAYTAGVKISIWQSGKFIIRDVVRGQWAAEEREDIIRVTAEADGTNVRIGIEQEGGSGGKESAQATIRNLAGFSVIADRPTGDKVFRADPFSVQVNNGNVFILKGEWNKVFLDELEMFPNGLYKDQVDAAAGAFAMLTRKKRVRVIR